MTHESSKHEYAITLTEKDRLEILDMLTLVAYYINDLDNESVPSRLAVQKRLSEFFGGLWRQA